MRSRFTITDTYLISLLSCYDKFLGILNDSKKRYELEEMKMEDINKTETFIEAREIADSFQEALFNIFLNDDKHLQSLTLKYGVF